MLTQAVNKLHANCNQIEMIKRKSAKWPQACNDVSLEWFPSHPFSAISPWQLSMDLQWKQQNLHLIGWANHSVWQGSHTGSNPWKEVKWFILPKRITGKSGSMVVTLTLTYPVV